jgi:hypothetical protein
MMLAERRMMVQMVYTALLVTMMMELQGWEMLRQNPIQNVSLSKLKDDTWHPFDINSWVRCRYCP